MLKINEIFHSLQGEGPFSGYPALFIRFAGCNLKCPFCFGVPAGRRKPDILMANGPKKKLTAIQKGDVLLTYDEAFNLVETTVTNTMTREVNKWLRIKINGIVYFVTPEHPFFTTSGLKSAAELQIGDMIYHSTPSQTASYRMQADKNPMKNPEIASRSAANTDYVAMGQTLSATLQEKIKNGTYLHPWSRMSQEQKDRVSAAFSESKMGEKNPNWKGGSNLPNFEALKTVCAKAGDMPCKRCLEIKKLEVHHLDGIHDNDDPQNLTTICHKCHSQVHKRGLNFWINDNRSDGKSFEVTADMRQILSNGFAVEEIKSYDRTNMQQFPHQSTRPKPMKVYNLTCEPYNSYMLDYMWVHNCDTKHQKVNFELEQEELFRIIMETYSPKAPTRLIVITGGEPFLQDFSCLVTYLTTNNFVVQIETNGSIFRPGFPFDATTIVCSPKEGCIDPRIIPFVYAWKYLISDEMECPIPPKGAISVFLQPLDEKDIEKNQKNVARTVEYCLATGYKLSLQIQKIIKVP